MREWREWAVVVTKKNMASTSFFEYEQQAAWFYLMSKGEDPKAKVEAFKKVGEKHVKLCWGKYSPLNQYNAPFKVVYNTLNSRLTKLFTNAMETWQFYRSYKSLFKNKCQIYLNINGVDFIEIEPYQLLGDDYEDSILMPE